MVDNRHNVDFRDLKARIQYKLLSELDPSVDVRSPRLLEVLQELFSAILNEEGVVLSRAERERLYESITADILGYGPLETLLSDETVDEIFVNGPKNVFVSRKGHKQKTSIQFDDNEHVLRIIDRIVAPLGRRVDESHPYEDARLSDGSRVNVVIPPIAQGGPMLTIKKFEKRPLVVSDLIRFGTLTPQVVAYLQSAVIAGLNIVVAGGPSSGKTTLLNVLSGLIPENERVVTIEDAAELQLQLEHVITLETRPPNIEGRGQVSTQDLINTALALHPDRLVLGDVRSGEALGVISAMSAGFSGVMTTLSASSPRDTLSRLETMGMMAGMDIPIPALRTMIAAGIDVIIQMKRTSDGRRRVDSVCEVILMDDQNIELNVLFAFEEQGVYEGGNLGRLQATGTLSRFLDKFETNGATLDPATFDRNPNALSGEVTAEWENYNTPDVKLKSKLR